MDITVASVQVVGPDAIAVTFETPEGFAAQPGQFVKLTATVEGEEVSRFYTLSSPHVGDTFEVTLTVDPEGSLGPHLANLDPGDTLGMAGPFGSDYYEAEERTLVLAGGPGVGAGLAIAERTLEEWGETALVYVDDDPIHGERLSALEERGAFLAVLDRSGDVSGAIETAIEDVTDEFDVREGEVGVFVYGFADFVDLATDALAAAEVPEGGWKVESFGPAPE